MEEYLMAMCLQNASPPNPPSSTGKDSRTLRAFAELTDEASKFIFPYSVEELWERYLVNDDFVENWLQSPFFRTLLEDPAIVRGCLLSHPLIIKLIELNPGLDSIIQKDENIRMVTETLLHHRQIFAPEARIAIISQLEKELGHSLQLGPEHVSYLFMYSPDRFYPEHLKTT